MHTPLPQAALFTLEPERRHQWYQLGPKVTIDIYAKNQQQDAVKADLTNNNSQLKITITGGSSSSAAAAGDQQQQQDDYVLDLDLFDAVQPDMKIEVLRTKVEITLTKAKATQSWPQLEKGAAKGPAVAGVSAAAAAAESTGPRMYPSSKGPKDWSKVEGTEGSLLLE